MSPISKKKLFVFLVPVCPLLCLCFCWFQKPLPADTTFVPTGIPYDLQNPSLSINLASEDLREISALSPSDEKSIFLTISDERGELFFIDANNGGAITHRVLFRDKGDFEGVEMVGEHLWALKSNGKLYEIGNWKSSTPVVNEFDTPLSKKDDVEGLGYDAKRHALLLACKGDPDSAYLRNIYAFDLRSKQLDETPLYSIDPNDVNRLVPYNETEKHDYFSPSAVAINPKTNELYIISSALKRLLVLNTDNGSIRFAVRLDKKLLPQPEGIAFDPDGNLYISSEGKKGEGRLLLFNYVKM